MARWALLVDDAIRGLLVARLVKDNDPVAAYASLVLVSSAARTC